MALEMYMKHLISPSSSVVIVDDNTTSRLPFYNDVFCSSFTEGSCVDETVTFPEIVSQHSRLVVSRAQDFASSSSSLNTALLESPQTPDSRSTFRQIIGGFGKESQSFSRSDQISQHSPPRPRLNRSPPPGPPLTQGSEMDIGFLLTKQKTRKTSRRVNP